MRISFLATIVVAAACLLNSCQSASVKSGAPLRITVLPFENLSGDDSLNWMQEAAPIILVSQWTGSNSVISFRSATIRDATSAEANRVVHGYFDRRKSVIHFEVSVEDTANHKMVQTFSFDSNLLEAADHIARAIEPTARAFPTSRMDALEAWGKHDFEAAVKLDPDFGSAWLEWLEVLSSTGKEAEALDQAAQALQRTSLRAPIERAQIAVIKGRLDHNDAELDKASLELISLLPLDTNLPKALADQAANARHYDQAVRLYREAIRRSPNEAGLYNLLGYELFYSGDLAESRRQLDAYSRYPGQEANAADSQGEVLFMAGQFADAEHYFLTAHEKSPTLLAGGDLSKAAYAHWLAGDRPGADKLFARYLDFRKQQHDPALVWRQAVWDYATGRQAQAIAELEKAEPQQLHQQQLTVWKNRDKLQLDPAALQKTYRATAPAADGLVRVFYAAALLKQGKRNEAKQLLAWWPLPDSGDPLLQSLIFPTYQDLKRQLP